MELEVWTEPNVKKEAPVRIRLRVDYDDHLVLEVVDSDGDRVPAGQIATISPKGLHKCHGLSSGFGFPMSGTQIGSI